MNAIPNKKQPTVLPRRQKIALLSSDETSPTISAKYAQALIEGGAEVQIFYRTWRRGMPAAEGYKTGAVRTPAPVDPLLFGRRNYLVPGYWFRRLQLFKFDTIVAEDPALLEFALNYARIAGKRLVYMPFEYYPGASYATPEL